MFVVAITDWHGLKLTKYKTFWKAKTDAVLLASIRFCTSHFIIYSSILWRGFIYTVNESLVILGEVIDEREIEKA